MVRTAHRNRLPPQLRLTIRKLIDAKRTEGSISVSELASEVHRVFPECSVPEPDLRAAIAGQAVKAGRVVDFDRPCPDRAISAK